MLRATRLAQQQRLALALLGGEPEAGADRGRRRCPAGSVLPVDGHRARRTAAGAVDGLEDLRAAGADQAREADDLARAHR